MEELLSPKLDIVFKKLFTEHLDLLKHFVASVLSVPTEQITDLILTNPEMVPEESDGKFSRLDLRLALNNSQIDIEIQVRKIPSYADRALFYWAKLYTSDLKTGETYQMLKQAISINLLDFNLFEDRTEAHAVVVPTIRGTQRILSDKMLMHFFELKKVGKNDSENLGAQLQMWLNFLNVKKPEDLAMFDDNETMSKAAEALRVMSGDERIREAARLREKRLHDEASALAGAREEGKIEGKIEILIDLVKDGELSLKVAARFANMSEAQLAKLCQCAEAHSIGEA